MRKMLISVICVLLLCVSATAGSFATTDSTIYDNSSLGFSLQIPAEVAEDITIVTTGETSVGFYYTPCYGTEWGGDLFSIKVFQPRERYFTDAIIHAHHQVVAFGEDCVYAWQWSGGGTHFPPEKEADYMAVYNAISLDYLRENLRPIAPDAWPQLRGDCDLSSLAEEADSPLTRGDAASLFYGLLSAENQGGAYETQLTDLQCGDSCYEAVAYLESYGMIVGYPDGTFRPHGSVTRAELVTWLHRLTFAPADGWYGDGMPFSDVIMEPGSHWALYDLNSAWEKGWITGYPDGTIRPDAPVSRGDAAAMVGRMLGQ